MNPEQIANLEEQVAKLSARVQQMEEALVRQNILSPESLHRSSKERANGVESSAPVIPLTAASEEREKHGETGASAATPFEPPCLPAAAPSFGYTAEGATVDERSLESRIGSQWFNRIAIAAVLIAAAWFLKLAMDNHWIGPMGRVLIGLAAGAGLIVWSERFRSRGFAVFSYSLKAAGSGTLYLSLWAAFSLYQLIPSGVAFVAMILVTAFNGYMAWFQDAELLGLYAIAGALSTPLLVSTGGEPRNNTLQLYVGAQRGLARAGCRCVPGRGCSSRHLPARQFSFTWAGGR
jgi:uncharacterized membrane protein